MLLNSFIQIPGIGIKTEKKIWGQGIKEWSAFFRRKPHFMSKETYELCLEHLREDLKCCQDPAYLSKRFPKSEHWRLYEQFKDKCAYLDIETDSRSEVTVAGVYDGRSYKPFINTINLYELEFEVSKYAIIVTFSGSSFDIPLLRRHFPGLSLPPIHIDLKFLCKRLGLKGGLKAIESELGIYRPPEIRGLTGYEALLLWESYQNGQEKSLELLLTYNKFDCTNLEELMIFAYESLRKSLLECANM